MPPLAQRVLLGDDRDRRNLPALRMLGWTVLVVLDCDPAFNGQRRAHLKQFRYRSRRAKAYVASLGRGIPARNLSRTDCAHRILRYPAGSHLTARFALDLSVHSSPLPGQTLRSGAIVSVRPPPTPSLLGAAARGRRTLPNGRIERPRGSPRRAVVNAFKSSYD